MSEVHYTPQLLTSRAGLAVGHPIDIFDTSQYLSECRTAEAIAQVFRDCVDEHERRKAVPA